MQNKKYITRTFAKCLLGSLRNYLICYPQPHESDLDFFVVDERKTHLTKISVDYDNNISEWIYAIEYHDDNYEPIMTKTILASSSNDDVVNHIANHIRNHPKTTIDKMQV